MNEDKLFLKHTDGTLTDETDYYNVTLNEALDDFCKEYQCTSDNVFYMKLED